MPGTAYRDIGKNRDARKKDTKGARRAAKTSTTAGLRETARRLLQVHHQGHKDKVQLERNQNKGRWQRQEQQQRLGCL
jgi:hypothetical protein